MDLTNFVGAFHASPRLTLFFISPVLAIISVFLWHLSGNCAERACNSGAKTVTCWKNAGFALLSLGGLIVTLMCACTGGLAALNQMNESNLFVFYLIGFFLLMFAIGKVPQTTVKQVRK